MKKYIITIECVRTYEIMENDEEEAIDKVEEKMYGQPKEPCEDCISREDAINKIEEWANGFEEGGYFSGKSVADAIRACGGIIAELPPVRPKYTNEEIDRTQKIF